MYVVKFYIINLFLLMRNNHHQFVCVNQMMIMIIITTIIIMFQFVLNESFDFCFQFFSDANLRNKFESKDREAMSNDCNWILKHLFFLFLAESKISNIWKKTFVMKNSMKFLNHDFNIFSHVFQHEFFQFSNSVMWISDDLLKISINKIFRIKQRYTNVKIFNKHANFNEKKNWWLYKISMNFLK